MIGRLGRLLRSWFGERRPTLPERDAWEGVWAIEHKGLPFPCVLSFSYVDKEGQHSKRTVESKQLIETESGLVVFGFCRARQANRTFYVDRMGSLSDADTGEVIDATPTALMARWAATPQGRAVETCRHHDDELTVLSFIGRSSGRLSKGTLDGLVTWLASHADSAGADPAEIRRQIGQREEPTQTAWRRALGRLASADEARRESLRRAVESLRAPAKRASAALRNATIDETLAKLT